MNQQPLNNPPLQNPPAASGLSNALSSIKDSVKSAFSGFSNQPNATETFRFSNTIIAKFAFLIFVIIVFMFFVNLGINLITYFTSPQSMPYIVEGMLQGNVPVTIPQDPRKEGSIQLLRSNNESLGAEFTWSIWLYITDLPQDKTKYQHIFNKGNNVYNSLNVATVNNGPGLYFGNPSDPNKLNSLYLIMDTVDQNDKNTSVVINDIPLQKWVHVAIRMENNVIDVYVNGTVSARLSLSNVPKQNFADIMLFQNGGFSGNISNLRYFDKALNVFDINSLIKKGPNMNASAQQKGISLMSNYDYLSSIWYGSKL
jgi:hypothetical protein